MSRHAFGKVKKYKHNPKCGLCKERFTCDNGNRKYCDGCIKKFGNRYVECEECGELCCSQPCKKCRKAMNEGRG